MSNFCVSKHHFFIILILKDRLKKNVKIEIGNCTDLGGKEDREVGSGKDYLIFLFLLMFPETSSLQVIKRESNFCG